MNSSGPKPQQLHPCTGPTSDSIRWPVSCFVHELMWQAHQLVQTEGSQETYAGKLEEGINTLSGELLGLPLSEEFLNPMSACALSCSGAWPRF